MTMQDNGPQTENGYTRIADEILEALCKTQLSAYETRVLMCIIRKTYGYNKKSDWISLSQFEKMTNLQRPHICRALRMLEEQNIITERGKDSLPKGAREVSFNKYYSQWKPLPKGARSHASLPKGARGLTNRGNLPLPKGAHTIENITKDTLTKKSDDRERNTKDEERQILQKLKSRLLRPIGISDFIEPSAVQLPILREIQSMVSAAPRRANEAWDRFCNYKHIADFRSLAAVQRHFRILLPQTSDDS